ncbi:MAG: hypothetical protein ABIK92_14195 [Pseudomonadota bacterium]
MKCFVYLSRKLCLAVVFCFGLNLSAGLAAEQGTGEGVPSEVSISTNNSPKILFEELFFDFGKVSQNTLLEHIFVFKNIGTGVLHIYNVKAG